MPPSSPAIAAAAVESADAGGGPETPALVPTRHWPADQEAEAPSELVTFSTARAAASAARALASSASGSRAGGARRAGGGGGGVIEVEVGQGRAGQSLRIGQPRIGVLRREPRHGDAAVDQFPTRV